MVSLVGSIFARAAELRPAFAGDRREKRYYGAEVDGNHPAAAGAAAGASAGVVPGKLTQLIQDSRTRAARLRLSLLRPPPSRRLRAESSEREEGEGQGDASVAVTASANAVSNDACEENLTRASTNARGACESGSSDDSVRTLVHSRRPPASASADDEDDEMADASVEAAPNGVGVVASASADDEDHDMADGSFKADPSRAGIVAGELVDGRCVNAKVDDDEALDGLENKTHEVVAAGRSFVECEQEGSEDEASAAEPASLAQKDEESRVDADGSEVHTSPDMVAEEAIPLMVISDEEQETSAEPPLVRVKVERADDLPASQESSASSCSDSFFPKEAFLVLGASTSASSDRTCSDDADAPDVPEPEVSGTSAPDASSSASLSRGTCGDVFAPTLPEPEVSRTSAPDAPSAASPSRGTCKDVVGAPDVEEPDVSRTPALDAADAGSLLVPSSLPRVLAPPSTPSRRADMARRSLESPLHRRFRSSGDESPLLRRASEVGLAATSVAERPSSDVEDDDHDADGQPSPQPSPVASVPTPVATPTTPSTTTTSTQPARLRRLRRPLRRLSRTPSDPAPPPRKRLPAQPTEDLATGSACGRGHVKQRRSSRGGA